MVNNGSESSSYLQFIVDHYNCLPNWVLFLHGHGQTKSEGDWHASTRHHPTDPAKVAALIDVDRLSLDFLALGHFSADDWSKGGSLHPAAKKFSDVKGGNLGHHAAFVPQEENKVQCDCGMLTELFPDKDCGQGWAFNVGAEFWVSRERILARPLQFWHFALRVAESGPKFARFGHEGTSIVSPAAYCFEATWHALLGEPFYGYTPAFKLIEELPRVPFKKSCRYSAMRQ